jgi:RNA polymerase sigma-70 factor (ECF subfamily)
MSQDDLAREREAIGRLRRGEIGGLEVLVRLHQTRAMRTAYLVVRDSGLAQEIVQSAFLRAYERIAQLDPERAFGPWFCTSVLRDAIKLAERRARSHPLDAAARVADSSETPETMWEQAETAQEVWAALGRLTPEQRAAVVARYYLGLNEAEMSRVLACPKSTLKWRLHAARARLRLLLAPALTND